MAHKQFNMMHRVGGFYLHIVHTTLSPHPSFLSLYGCAHSHQHNTCPCNFTSLSHTHLSHIFSFCLSIPLYKCTMIFLCLTHTLSLCLSFTHTHTLSPPLTIYVQHVSAMLDLACTPCRVCCSGVAALLQSVLQSVWQIVLQSVFQRVLASFYLACTPCRVCCSGVAVVLQCVLQSVLQCML